FLYQSYVNVLDLHSFPTRRSSDLDRGEIPAGRSLKIADLKIVSLRGRWTLCILTERSVLLRLRVVVAVPSEYQDRSGLALRTIPDRKSTRLNSSHEWISYAVFCLK